MEEGSKDRQLAWLWTSEKVPRRNGFVEFRRTIEYAGNGRLLLHLTADSRYYLFVNGKRIGMGPCRCWPHDWEYDTYDLTDHLADGRCLIGVLVNAYGQGTMQYIVSNPGFGACIEALSTNGASEVFPVSGWKARKSLSAQFKVPRMAMQMAFDEVYDAREEHDWNEPEYDDTSWPEAISLDPPHNRLQPRSIPFFEEAPVSIKAVLESETVISTRYHWTLNLRPYLHLEDYSAAPMIYKGFLYTQIKSPEEQEIRFVRPHWYHQGPMFLNGVEIPALEPGFARAPVQQAGRLKEGWNLFLVPLPGIEEKSDGVEFGPALFSQFSINMDCDHPVTLKADIEGDESSQWAFAGPFAFTKDEFDALRNRLHNAVVITPLEFAKDASAEECVRICQSMRNPFDEKGNGLKALFPEGAQYLQGLQEREVIENDTFLMAITDQPVDKRAVDISDTVLAGGDKPFRWEAPEDPAQSRRILIDFGYEFVGDQILDVEAGEGTVLDFHYFEFIQKDGRKNYAEDMNNTFRYICREGRQQYRSLIRRGYRYCWLTVRNQRKELRIHAMSGLFTSYPQDKQGYFQCEDSLLNKIWQVGHHTLQCCSEDTYTDCPTYEQVFWVGDMRNEALVDWVVNGDKRLWRRCLLLAAKSLDRSPIIESHVPSSQRSVLPAWSFLWMRSCREYLLYTGDFETSHQLLEYLKRNVEGVKRYINEAGLFEIRAWNMFDWAEMDTPDEGVVTHNNCFLVLALEEAAEFARWLGAEADATDFESLAGSVRDSINRLLWDEKVGAYVDCVHKDGSKSTVFSQQTQTVALRARIPEDDRLHQCREIVMHPPEGFVTAGSPFFQFFILEILSEEGRVGEMLEDIRKHWGFMINEGATTFWEMWSLKTGRLTRSHCHGWSSAPTYFLSAKVLGIEPIAPGFKQVRFRPFADGLGDIEGAYPTPLGLIRVACNNGEWRLDTPEGIEVIEEERETSLNSRDAS